MGSTPRLLSLAQLCAPASLAEVLADWGRRSREWPGPPARVAAWRHPKGVRSWALHDLHAAVRLADGSQDRHPIEPDQIDASLSEGHTVCGNASADPRLARVLTDLAACEAATTGEPFAKLYISPPGRGYVLHADRYHVLVVQLSGRKRWWYGERPAVSHAPAGAYVDPQGRVTLTHPYQGQPMLDDAGQPARPASDDALQQAVLSPGDLLYLPPGTWHRTESVSTSVALSLSPPRALPVERLMALLNRSLLSEPRLREPLGASDAAAALQKRLRDVEAVLARIDAPSLARAWAIEHEQRLARADPPVPAQVGELAADDPIEHAHARPVRWLTARDEQDGSDAVFFYGAGQEWSLPREARPLVEGLCAPRRFTIREAMTWAPALDEDDVRGVLEQLLAAGMLRRAVD